MTIHNKRSCPDDSDFRPIMRIIPDDARHPEFHAATKVHKYERIVDLITRRLAIRYVKPSPQPEHDGS